MASYHHTERMIQREKMRVVNMAVSSTELIPTQGRSWARICKCLRRPGIDTKESIPPAYVAWQAGTSKNRVVVPACQTGNRFLGSLKDSSSVVVLFTFFLFHALLHVSISGLSILEIQTWLLRQKKFFSFLYFLLHVHVLLSIHEIVFDS
jgi:hypothetical protein